MPERDPLRSEGDFVIDVEAGDGGPWAFKSYRKQTPFTITSNGDFVLRTGETERGRVKADGTATGVFGGSASPLTTKGDLYGHSTVDARIPVGSDGQVLTADSTQALGLKWAATATADALNTVASSGAAQTVNYTTADVWDITLTANCTLTLAGFTAGKPDYLTLVLRQDATGSRTVTWPTITWIGSGIAPTLQTAANAVDSIVLFSFDGGSTVYGIAQTSASGLKSGTAFPGSPSDGDLFYRTDRRILYEYVASVTRWLSLDRKYVRFSNGPSLMGTATSPIGMGYVPVFEDIYIESWNTTTRVDTLNSGNNGSNFWTAALRKNDPTATATTITSFTTASDTAGNYVSHSVSIAALVAVASFPMIDLLGTKTGTPGDFYWASTLVVRSAG